MVKLLIEGWTRPERMLWAMISGTTPLKSDEALHAHVRARDADITGLQRELNKLRGCRNDSLLVTSVLCSGFAVWVSRSEGERMEEMLDSG